MTNLVLVDAHSLAHRALAGPPSSPPAHRFFSLLGSVYAELHPTHMVLALDNQTSTLVRRQMCPSYKANRGAKPEGVAEFMDKLWSCCGELGLSLAKVDGWEADDVMASYALSWHHKFGRVYIVTPDKDMAQVVGANVMLYDYTTKSIRDRDDIYERFGVFPEQIPDYLALVGDRADGVAGVRGIGPKKARKLLSQFDSIEDIIEADALGVFSDDQKQELTLTKELVTVQSGLPVDDDIDRCRWRPLNPEDAGRSLHDLKATIALRASQLPTVPRNVRSKRRTDR